MKTVDNFTWQDWLDKHIHHLEVMHYAHSSVKKTRYCMGLFIDWCIERGLDSPLELDTHMLEAHVRYLYHFKQPNGEGLTPQTQRNRIVIIKGFYNWLWRSGYLTANPAMDICLPKVKRRIPQEVLSLEEVNALLNMPDLDTPKGIRDRAILETLYICGLRRNELINVKLRDINLDARTVFVQEGKGGYQRLLPMSDSLLHWIERYLYEAREKLLRSGGCEYLFVNHKGQQFKETTFSSMIRRYLIKGGIRDRGSAHKLRHAMATHMLDAGADIRSIQTMLGHQSLQSTQVYTHVSLIQLRKVHEQTHPKGKKSDDQSDLE